MISGGVFFFTDFFFLAEKHQKDYKAAPSECFFPSLHVSSNSEQGSEAASDEACECVCVNPKPHQQLMKLQKTKKEEDGLLGLLQTKEDGPGCSCEWRPQEETSGMRNSQNNEETPRTKLRRMGPLTEKLLCFPSGWKGKA